MKRALLAVILAFTFLAGNAPAALRSQAAEESLGVIHYLQPAGPSAVPWVKAAQQGGIIYLLYDSPARLERFDMEARLWLEPILMDQPPTAFTVSDSYIYICFGRRLARFHLDGSGETTLYTASLAIDDLVSLHGYLILHSDNMVISVNKTSGALADSHDLFDPWDELAPAPLSSRLYSSRGYIEFSAAGEFGKIIGVPYNALADMANLSRVFVFPNETLVASFTGRLYTADLSNFGSLPSPVADMAFYGAQPIQSRYGVLYAYNAELRAMGRFAPFYPPERVFASETSLFTLFNSADGAVISEIPPALLKLSPPGTTVPTDELHFKADTLFLGEGEILYLFSKANKAIFRWSVAQRQYLTSLPLPRVPDFLVYNEANNRIYLGYRTGEITQIELSGRDQSSPSSESAVTELPFANLPYALYNLSPAGAFLLASPSWGDNPNYYAYDQDGGLVYSGHTFDEFNSDSAWDAARLRLFFLQTAGWGRYMDVLHLPPDGVIQEVTHSSSDDQHQAPVRMAPDGSLVFSAPGRFYNPDTLNLLADLDEQVTDAAWSGGELFTLASGGGARLQKRADLTSVIAEQPVAGGAVGLFATGEGLLVVTDVAGKPHFSLWDAELKPVFAPAADVLFLPALGNPSRCVEFQDDFSDPASGWYVGEDDSFSYKYHQGLYWIRSKVPASMLYSFSPSCRFAIPEVQVDVRWIDNFGGGLGLAVGVMGEMDRYHLFVIYPAEKIFEVWRFDGQLATRLRENYSSQISRYDPNTLKVRYWSGDYNFYINGEQVSSTSVSWEDWPPYPSRVGLFTLPYTNLNNTEAIFDNFRVINLAPGEYPGYP